MFHFRLAKVMKHRRRIVENEARRLQELALALNQLLASRHAFAADVEEAALAAHRSRRDTVDLGFERAAAAFVEGRRKQIELLDVQAGEQRIVVERQRRVLVTAQHEVSVLERLEERQRADWEQTMRRREQKQLDEVAARRHDTRWSA